MNAGSKINILIIEDNEDDLYFIKKALSSFQCDISIIRSGIEAYEYLLNPEITPDIILLDKRLPGMNGLELLRKLNSQNIDYGIIFLTADDNIETVVEAMKYGALDFVVKSADLKDLLPGKVEKVYNLYYNKAERKRAEEELINSVERFRSMFLNSPFAYQALDENGYYIDLNDKLCEMFGYKHEELIGKSFGDLWASQDKEDFRRAFEFFKSQGFISADLELRHKKGHVITVLLEGRIQKDPNGRFVKTHCILSNITERKLMEKTLSYQYEFQRLVADISSSFINIGNESLNEKMDIALRKIGKFYDVDRCYVLLFPSSVKGDYIDIAYEWCAKGVTPQKGRLIEKPWNNFRWFYRKMQKRQPIDIPNIAGMPKMARAEKEEFASQDIISLLCLPMINKDEIIGFLGLDSVKAQKNWQKREVVQLSVLEKILTGEFINKKADEDLKESELRYRTVSDYTYNWEYWIDAGNNIKYMSPAVKRITGYEVGEFVNDPDLLEKIVYKDDLPLWKKHKYMIEDQNDKSDYHEIEFRVNSKTGEVIWIGHLCRKIYSDMGKYLGLRVSNKDITQRVETEKQLLNVTAEVEQRERDRFSKELHDGLGPLLSNVKLYFQWLAETDDESKRKLVTEKGNESIDLAIQTTREIAYNLNPRILNKMGIVDAIDSVINRTNEAHKIKIRFSYNSKERFEKLAEKTLYHIACELVNNTIKHSKADKAEMSFILNDNGYNNIVYFYYSDNGIGFNVEEAKDIHKNKGMGLWSIFQKVEALRGKVNVNSIPGEGMDVYIEVHV